VTSQRVRFIVLVVTLVVAGVVPRAWRLDTPGLTSDEAFSWRLTGYPTGEMLRRATLDVHPPLFYLVLGGWRRAFGDGVAALRGLSVAMGLLAIAIVFVLVQEAMRLDEKGGGGTDVAGRAAALAAAFTTVQATQVLQSRNARMYALGTVLAVLSAWILLRAMRAAPRRAGWWVLWGLAAAAAVATHYYLAFTIAAEAVWAAWPARTRPRWAHLRGLALGIGVAMAALAPWSGAFWRQARQVRAEYWIPPATPTVLREGLARWALGLDPGRAALPLALVVVASLVAAVLAGRAGRVFALLAAAPWVLGLALSEVAGRPLVLERYMLFAQPFLFCAWAVAIASVARPITRMAVGTALVLALVPGLVSIVATYPADPPALSAAARFLKRQAGAGDLVVVESPRALNKLRYYARQAGGERLDIRCALPERVPLSPHVSHVVSLAEGDSVPAEAVFASGPATIWLGHESTAPPAPAPAGWSITYARIFEGGEETRFALARYQRADNAP
jgi:mannosyltransferase